jgi:aspartate aminotransferase/aminotransferase
MPKISNTVQNTIEAMSIKYNNMIYDLKSQGEDIITLSLGEAFFDLPLFSFDDLPFPDIYHYSHSRGILELREKLADFFNKEYGFKFSPEKEIIVTAGSKVAIHMSLMSIIDQGDEVIIYEPYWVSYTEQVKLCNGVPVTISQSVDIMETENYISPKTKCIIINNPHNPTGKIYTDKELGYLLKLAQENDLYILSDEAYSDFVPESATFHSLGKMDEQKSYSIVCNSISKNYGMSGWRLGYVIANETIINQILKINQHLVTCPATILEYYVAKHFYEILEITKPQIASVVAHRQRVIEYMDDLGLCYSAGVAAWYIFASISPSKLGSEEFCTELLNRYKIGCVPGLGYGISCDKHIRVCVGTESMERTIVGLKAIKSLILETS